MYNKELRPLFWPCVGLVGVWIFIIFVLPKAALDFAIWLGNLL